MTKTKAIQLALARLGMQASSEEVVAYLATIGIEVTGRMVQQAKVELLKKSAEVRLQLAKVPKAGQRPTTMPRRVPPQRGGRTSSRLPGTRFSNTSRAASPGTSWPRWSMRSSRLRVT